MKSLLTVLFLRNWQRKIISVILAIIIWILVNNSLIAEKTYTNIPVKLHNVPAGMSVPSMRANGYLDEKINLKIVGYKKILDQLSQDDIQVFLNAESKEKDWVAIIRKNELVFLNKFINPYPFIRTISHDPFVVSMTKTALE